MPRQDNIAVIYLPRQMATRLVAAAVLVVALDGRAFLFRLRLVLGGGDLGLLGLGLVLGRV